MHPAAFEYVRAESVQQAVDLLSSNAEARLLAGGHSLVPMMKLRLAQPAQLVDIGRLEELRGIAVEERAVRIGPLTTHAELHGSDELAAHCPLLAEAAGKIGDPQVRNKGTIGGNIAHADPASDLPAVLVAAGATIHLLGTGGERQVPAGDFFVGLMTTALAADEIITAIEVPAFADGTGSAYLKVEHPASGYAVCGAAATVTMGDGACTAASLCFNGVSATPHHAAAVAEALVGTAADGDAIADAIGHLAIDEPLGDRYAAGEYRVHLARVYGRRALARAAAAAA